jgi:MarR family transcriptional regulator, organic hydroperoxide resistance regulator
MSISKARNTRNRREPRKAAPPRAPKTPRGPRTLDFRLPPTISEPALLERGSDERFRRLVNDLLTIASRMSVVREHLGSRMGISAPQYSLLMAIGQFQGERGVGVTAIARVLHVSSAFVATETGKLAQAGLLIKRGDPEDGRAVLLNLTRAGRTLIERNADEVRAVNDMFFGELTPATFAAASGAMAVLVRGSARAMAHVDRAESRLWREAAE